MDLYSQLKKVNKNIQIQKQAEPLSKEAHGTQGKCLI